MMNIKSLSLIVVIAGLLVAMTACAGYTLGDYIGVKTTPNVQVSTGVGETVKLSEAPYVRQRYVDDVLVELAQFDENIRDAQLFADFAGSLLNTGLALTEGPLQGVPAGGAIFAALGGLAGLFIRKPGTQKEIDAAWDEASAKAREAVLEGIKAKDA